jgi:hypothetical protein
MKYQPNQIIWFRNLPLEGDYMGLSDIESLWDIAIARASIIPEAAVRPTFLARALLQG